MTDMPSQKVARNKTARKIIGHFHVLLATRPGIPVRLTSGGWCRAFGQTKTIEAMGEPFMRNAQVSGTTYSMFLISTSNPPSHLAKKL